MITAKVFRSGNSQAVRLPKAFRFDADEVEILRRGDEIILRKIERKGSLARAFDVLMKLPEDMFEDIRDTRPPEQRESL